MTWVKMDDHFPEDPEAIEVGEDACWLHFLGIAYCSRNLTNGRLPKGIISRLTSKRNPMALVQHLLKVGWWAEDGTEFVIVRYLKHQRSREQIENDRRSARERLKKSRRSSGDVQQPETETEAEPEFLGEELRTSPNVGDVAARMSIVCKEPNLQEALRVVEMLSEHVDLNLIDECVGWAAKRDDNHAPRRPVYFLEALPEWAQDRGVHIPELRLVPR